MLHRVEFDWDGTAVTNVVFPEIPHFGASHRPWSAMVNPGFGPGRPSRVEGEDVATTTRAVTGTHAKGTNEVRIGMARPNPLTLSPAPDIDADYTLFISRDFGEDTMTIRWTTDSMPNHGFRLDKNGRELKTRIVNQLPEAVSAPEIFIRLNSKSNGGAEMVKTLPGVAG